MKDQVKLLSPRYEDIGEFALLSDCRTAALVSRAAAIVWTCFPRFDSPACFASLLGTDENGCWSIQCGEPITRRERRYLEGTMVLETRLYTDSGILQITDCLAIGVANPTIVRKIQVLQGKVAFCTVIRARFDYGSIVPMIEVEKQGIRAVAGGDAVMIRSSQPLEVSSGDVVARHELNAEGQAVTFTLCWHASYLESPASMQADLELARATAWWREWSEKCSYQGEWREVVIRSALTLKALTYAATGAVVAAPTTSLPEWPGGERNWDYRFVWLRDCALTLSALVKCGYLDEAHAWRDWLERSVGADPESIRPLYTVTGERGLTERNLDWLKGFAGSRPVREGNAASNQFQLDIHGEVFAALSFARRAGLNAGRSSSMDRALKLLTLLERAWHEPDEGIWETRGGRRHFTFSKVMAWVAFSAALEEDSGLNGPRELWKRVRTDIHQQVCKQGFSESKNSFVQSYGSDVVDASLLLLPIVGFLPSSDPRVIGTLRAVEAELRDGSGLVHRYPTSVNEGSDGLRGSEGAFLPCSFWLVDNWVLQGRLQEARAFFKKLLTLSNDLGLFAEEYDGKSQKLLGNFPQAFTHVAVIHSALALTTGAVQSGRR